MARVQADRRRTPIRGSVKNKAAQSLLRVRNWGELYENNRSRELARTNWFPAPNDLSANGYVELVSHVDGAAHLGVWIGLLMVASRAKPRGLLTREDGRPHALECANVSMSDFIAEVKKHAKNEWRNPAGFLRDLSQRFHSKTRSASRPNYSCNYLPFSSR